ncbi:peptidylprolyl isomerase [Patescibacteria group bacterium]|nr:peptidylprolyl isomerase [Patescibacteria group bacterium]MBU1256699.1 peptidylprolyl isomerase [Patescibacteria group bacterium]MBU1457475.1 peptidylprolyl isomerase [Patescibacteria group bacterium]
MLKKISLLLLSAIFLSACTTKPISPLVDDDKVLVNNQTTNQMTPTSTPPTLPISATINTSLGPITLELFPNKAPLTVANFVDLSTGSEGKDPFYNNLIFHRVISGFMIQGGDPLGTGTGGPGYSFADEFNQGLTFDKAGILAMANSGPNTNGSQFFITLAPTPHLNGLHTIFGQVIAGMDILEKIGNVEVGAQDKPIEDVVIVSINVTP